MFPFSMASFIVVVQDGMLSCIDWFVTCCVLPFDCFLYVLNFFIHILSSYAYKKYIPVFPFKNVFNCKYGLLHEMPS